MIEFCPAILKVIASSGMHEKTAASPVNYHCLATKSVLDTAEKLNVRLPNYFSLASPSHESILVI